MNNKNVTAYFKIFMVILWSVLVLNTIYTPPPQDQNYQCPLKGRGFNKILYDVANRYVTLTPKQWDEAMDNNPFDCSLHKTRRDVLAIPFWQYNKKRMGYTYGGFTADMGWVLMVSRYVLTTGNTKSIEFMNHWGHGCNLGWRCFFKEITPQHCMYRSFNTTLYNMKDPRTRHYVKLYKYYDDDKPWHGASRNKEILKIAGLDKVIQHDNDLQTMQILFHWVFRLNNHTRALVDAEKERVFMNHKSANYIGMHIRWGDKVGRGGGPKESDYVPIIRYIEGFVCYYEKIGKPPPSVIYVATDDYGAVIELRRLLGTSFKVYTSSTRADVGFSIKEYHSDNKSQESKFYDSVRLWADMEILSMAEVFSTSMESNIARTVHLMRRNRHANSTIDTMNIKRNTRSCCNSRSSPLNTRRNNCFWLCT